MIAVDPITVGARDAAVDGDWLSLVLQHHDQIRAAFSRAQQALAGGSRLAAMKGLAVLLTGHSLAEELGLYPVLAQTKPKGANKPYDEQTLAKIEMAALELIDPGTDAWPEKLDETRAAVLEHMLEEESAGSWTSRRQALTSPNLRHGTKRNSTVTRMPAAAEPTLRGADRRASGTPRALA